MHNYQKTAVGLTYALIPAIKQILPLWDSGILMSLPHTTPRAEFERILKQAIQLKLQMRAAIFKSV